jgi:ankyrin repeat protein
MGPYSKRVYGKTTFLLNRDKGLAKGKIYSQRTWHGEVAEILVANGARVNGRNIEGCVPLHTAAFGGHKELADFLIAHGADVNAKEKNKCTPLYSAALEGHSDVAELLIKKGADVNAARASGRTPPEDCISKRT